MNNNVKNYIAYDYHEIKAPENQMSFYLDCYESFGWEIDDRTQYRHGALMLRRDRKLANKTELTRLQSHFEACMAEIQTLEASKTSKATMFSLIVGILGTVFMAGAVFAATAEPPVWWLCAILAVPAFAGWGLAPVLYKKLSAKRSAEVSTLVDSKYEEIYQICEKGHGLL